MFVYQKLQLVLQQQKDNNVTNKLYTKAFGNMCIIQQNLQFELKDTAQSQKQNVI